MSVKLFLLKSFKVETMKSIVQLKAQADANIIQYLSYGLARVCSSRSKGLSQVNGLQRT